MSLFEAGLKKLLTEIDNEFTPRLSSRVNIDDYIIKISKNSTIIPIYDNGNLNAFIAFYCNDYKNRVAYLTMLAVGKDERNKGLGRLLVTTAIEYLKKIEFKYFRLEVSALNKKAIGVYSKSGFKVYEEKQGSYFMEKELV